MRHERPVVGFKLDRSTLDAVDAAADEAGVSRAAYIEHLVVLGMRGEVPRLREEAREGRRIAFIWTASIARVIRAEVDRLIAASEPE